MAIPTDPIDLKLIEILQADFPLIERPYAALAQRMNLSEDDLLLRLSALRSKTGIIRQISAIFDSRSLGYQSSLVAAKVSPDHLDDAAAIINQHPGVSHNYKREHDYNLWYTVAVPPDSSLGLERTVELLHRRSGAVATRLMPSLKMYKIGVKFDLSEDADVAPAAKPAAIHEIHFIASEQDKRFVRVLQQDLPGISRSFEDFAQQAQSTVPELLEAAERYKKLGVMRRFSAVLRHREAGFSANAMGVWPVPEPDCDRFGEIAAGFKAVSHCYRRPIYEDWPYSMYTMVHASSAAAADAVLEAISKATGYPSHPALYSTKEYKKVRVQYFTPEVAEWERREF